MELSLSLITTTLAIRTSLHAANYLDTFIGMISSRIWNIPISSFTVTHTLQNDQTPDLHSHDRRLYVQVIENQAFVLH